MRKAAQTVLIIFSFSVVALSFQNCAEIFPSENSKGSTPSVDTSALVAENTRKAITVLGQHCVGCHSPGSATQSPLADILDFDSLIQSGYIVMGEPQNSPLYLDVVDGVMPPVGQPDLSDLEVGQIRDWLLAENAIFDDVAGGGLGGGGDGGTPPTFTQINNTVIQLQCATCHQPGGQAPAGDFTTYDGIMVYVTPGNLITSPLYMKLLSTAGAGRMPLGGALPGPQIDAIGRWILDNAPNN